MRAMRTALLAAAMALATWAGGWTGVPLVAFLWGAFRYRAGTAAVGAAIAALVAWAALLVLAYLQGPLPLVAGMIGGLFGAPAAIPVLATLLFAVALGWSAGEVGTGMMRLAVSGIGNRE